MVMRMRPVIAKTGADATCVRVDLSPFFFDNKNVKAQTLVIAKTNNHLLFLFFFFFLSLLIVQQSHEN
mgnify:CR=1 FL=1